MQPGTPDAYAQYVENAVATRSAEINPFLQSAGVTELFHTPDQLAYATILNAGHAEHWLLSSQTFRLWLRNHLYRLSGDAPSDAMIRKLLNTLAGHALFEGTEHRVFVRIGEADGAIYLDLANADWQAVQITPDGWQVMDHPAVKFRRPYGMAPLPIPQRHGSLEDLRSYVNLTSEADWILVVSWLLSAFRPTGPYPILLLHGEQGTAKSTTARILRSLIDPNESPLRTVPRNERDFMIAATNGWAHAFDNLSQLPLWFADALCRLATGGGFATRKLRTDDDEVIFNRQQPCVLTSIEELSTRGDLLDRAIMIHLPHIPRKKRQPEQQFWRSFEAARPALLGALLDIVSAALRNLDHVHIDAPPRMADFVQWSCAAAEACDWHIETPNGLEKNSAAFVYSYTENITAVQHLQLDSVIAQAIQQLVESRPWSGTHRDLLDDLRRRVGSGHHRELPQTARALSAELDRLIPSLRSVGVRIGRQRRREGGTGQRIITLRKEDAIDT
jgi:hypothetical protein